MKLDQMMTDFRKNNFFGKITGGYDFLLSFKKESNNIKNVNYCTNSLLLY